MKLKIGKRISFAGKSLLWSLLLYLLCMLAINWDEVTGSKIDTSVPAIVRKAFINTPSVTAPLQVHTQTITHFLSCPNIFSAGKMMSHFLKTMAQPLN